MGASQSVQQQLASPTPQEVTDAIEKQKFMVDKAVTENMANLSTLLNQFNKNDTTAIVEKIKSMDEFKGKVPDAMLNKIGSLHKNILESIDTSFSNADKKKQISTDKGVSEYINKLLDKEMDGKMNEYLENPFIKKEPEIYKGMQDIAGSIKNIRGRYKYFEYKYIQTNIFFILFIKHVYETVRQFIDETNALNKAKDAYHLILIQNVVKTLQLQLSDQTKKISDVDTNSISGAIAELTHNVMDSINKQKQDSEKVKQKSLKDILGFLMERETDFADELVKFVEDYKGTHPKPAQGPSDFVKASSVNEVPQPSPNHVFRTGEYGLGWYLSPVKPILPKFVAAATFDLSKKPGPNYDFKTGTQGTGWYLQEQPIASMASAYGPQNNPALAVPPAVGGFVRGSSSLPQNFFDL